MSRAGAPRISSVRAYVVGDGGADYHAQSSDHWIDGQIATPMSRYAEYRAHRSSFGLDVLGSLVVEVEAEDGTVGLGVSTGGVPTCFLVERHLARFVEGKRADQIELIWDQMWRASLFYGRKGLALFALSAIDLALWDLLARIREEPVHALLGGTVRDELPLYATGPRPDVAKELGFVGGKVPLIHGPAEGDAGLRRNLEQAESLGAHADDSFFLAYDCWMALDLEYADRLGNAVRPLGFRWIEECLPPDDYWGYAELRRRAPTGLWITTGEHEAGLQGFRMLIDMECCDVVQPDVTWCGGLTELRRIAAYADAHGTLVVPHGSSVYSYHFMMTRANAPFAEFLVMSPSGTEIVPMFSPLFLGEPIPERGHIRLDDTPGFGVELNRDLPLERPFAR